MPLTGMKIVIDPGHGGVDGGADYEELQEKTITLSTAFFLRDYLQAAGAQVYLTREADRDLAPTDLKGYSNRKAYDLRMRKELIETHEPDLFLSLHLNSVPNSSWQGAQTFFYPNDENKRFSEELQRRLVDTVNTNRQALAITQIYLLKHSQVTSALVELGFLSNQEERELLVTEEYQRLLASSLYEGIVEYTSSKNE